MEMIRRLDRERFAPEMCCLKQLGELGEQLAEEGIAAREVLYVGNDMLNDVAAASAVGFRTALFAATLPGCFRPFGRTFWLIFAASSGRWPG